MCLCCWIICWIARSVNMEASKIDIDNERRFWSFHSGCLTFILIDFSIGVSSLMCSYFVENSHFLFSMCVCQHNYFFFDFIYFPSLFCSCLSLFLCRNSESSKKKTILVDIIKCNDARACSVHVRDITHRSIWHERRCACCYYMNMHYRLFVDNND